MKVNTLKELYKFIVVDKNEFEELENNCERVNNYVYEDEDFNEFLRSINANEINRTKSKIVIADGEIKIELDYIERENRFGYELGNDTVFMFETMKIVA